MVSELNEKFIKSFVCEANIYQVKVGFINKLLDIQKLKTLNLDFFFGYL